MPAYLIHGFRWARKSIRIHVIIHDIDDAAPDWIISPPTSIALLNSFYTTFDFLPPPEPTSSVDTSPSRSLPRSRPRRSNSYSTSSSHNRRQVKAEPRCPKFNDWSLVKFMEQYQSNDSSVSAPHAFVGDYITQIDLSCDINKEIEIYDQARRDEVLSLSTAASGFETPNTPHEASSPSFPPSMAVQYPGDYVPANMQEMGQGIRGMSSRDFKKANRKIGWLEKLRDQVEKNAEIGWFVVICEDEERRLDYMVRLRALSSGVMNDLSEELDEREEEKREEEKREPPPPRLRTASWFSRSFGRNSEKNLKEKSAKDKEKGAKAFGLTTTR